MHVLRLGGVHRRGGPLGGRGWWPGGWEGGTPEPFGWVVASERKSNHAIARTRFPEWSAPQPTLQLVSAPVRCLPRVGAASGNPYGLGVAQGTILTQTPAAQRPQIAGVARRLQCPTPCRRPGAGIRTHDSPISDWRDAGVGGHRPWAPHGARAAPLCCPRLGARRRLLPGPRWAHCQAQQASSLDAHCCRACARRAASASTRVLLAVRCSRSRSSLAAPAGGRAGYLGPLLARPRCTRVQAALSPGCAALRARCQQCAKLRARTDVRARRMHNGTAGPATGSGALVPCVRPLGRTTRTHVDGLSPSSALHSCRRQGHPGRPI